MARRSRHPHRDALAEDLFSAVNDFLSQTAREGLGVVHEDLMHSVRAGVYEARGRIAAHAARFVDGDVMYLVHEKVVESGVLRHRWAMLPAAEPSNNPNALVGAYMDDPAALALMIFEGKLIFRDIKQLPGSTGP